MPTSLLPKVQFVKEEPAVLIVLVLVVVFAFLGPAGTCSFGASAAAMDAAWTLAPLSE